MMKLTGVAFLFGFKGRINRAKYWLTSLAMIGWMLLIAWLTLRWLTLVAHGDLQPPMPYVDFRINVGDVFAIFDPAIYRSPQWVEIVMRVIRALSFPMLLWIYLATSVKRLHDRDKSGWWMVPFFVILDLYSRFYNQLPDSHIVLLFTLAVVALTIWGGIELFLLRGSPRINRFGPDPLAPVDTRPPWDEGSEIEFIPHKAGPPVVTDRPSIIRR